MEQFRPSHVILVDDSLVCSQYVSHRTQDLDSFDEQFKAMELNYQFWVNRLDYFHPAQQAINFRSLNVHLDQRR